jgi:signal peptidase I
MSILTNRKSYAETVEGRRRFLSRLGVLLLVFFAFEFVAGIFVCAFSVSSRAMDPTITAGDRVLACPLVYGPFTVFGKLPALARPTRGDIVIVDPPYAPRSSFWASFADAFVRFITLQQVSPVARGQGAAQNGPFVERVIALPGDSVEMDDFVFKVKSAGSEHFLTEFELSSLRYDISKPAQPEGWTDSFPLSGSMPEMKLGKDEYFLASDNRGASSDSRLWGPEGIERFRAKVFLRYWPFSRFGSP